MTPSSRTVRLGGWAWSPRWVPAARRGDSRRPPGRHPHRASHAAVLRPSTPASCCAPGGSRSRPSRANGCGGVCRPTEGAIMPTPHSEHAIKDFDLWNTTFQRFSEHRQQAGVLQHRIPRPVDDPRYVVIDVDFETTTKAEAFLDFLQTKVWASSENAPALVGTPHTKILEPPRADSHHSPGSAASRAGALGSAAALRATGHARATRMCPPLVGNAGGARPVRALQRDARCARFGRDPLGGDPRSRSNARWV